MAFCVGFHRRYNLSDFLKIQLSSCFRACSCGGSGGCFAGESRARFTRATVDCDSQIGGTVGDYAWVLSPDADRVLQKAFATAQGRRSDAAADGEGIVFRGAVISEGYHLVAVRGSDERGEVVSPVAAWSLFRLLLRFWWRLSAGVLFWGFRSLFSREDFSRRWVNPLLCAGCCAAKIPG